MLNLTATEREALRWGSEQDDLILMGLSDEAIAAIVIEWTYGTDHSCKEWERGFRLAIEDAHTVTKWDRINALERAAKETRDEQKAARLSETAQRLAGVLAAAAVVKDALPRPWTNEDEARYQNREDEIREDERQRQAEREIQWDVQSSREADKWTDAERVQAAIFNYDVNETICSETANDYMDVRKKV
jgi:hypothetical protein